MKVVYLSTYPPFEDGIATYVHDLVSAQQVDFGEQTKVEIAAIDITGIDKDKYPKEVKWIIPIQDKNAYIETANAINRDPEVAWINIQHEYGIYGGEWGSYLLSFLKQIKKPVVVTMHTMLPRPHKHVRKLTQQIVDRAEAIVVLTAMSKATLQRLYQVQETKVTVIQHGIHPIIWTTPSDAKKKARLSKKLVLRTFGFLSRGKGIEYLLSALPKIVKKFPNVVYYVMGETHPLVKRSEGESYRQSLERLVDELGIKRHVRFVNKYLSVEELLEALKATDIYVFTSLNPDQAVSGTFSYALGTGRAVVSTKFSQAMEYIDDEVGVLVDMKRPFAYTKAISALLSNDYKREEMHRRAYGRTRNMLWSRVAMAYQKIYWGGEGKKWWFFPPVNLKHLKNMTSKTGIWQFAKRTMPDKKYGYTLDDNARAALFCARYWTRIKLQRQLKTYVNFIKMCQQDDGMLINYITADVKPEIVQNADENPGDANGRTIWALGEIIGKKQLPTEIREKAETIWKKRMQAGWETAKIRTRAYVIKGLAAKGNEEPELIKQANILARHYEENADGAWQWFEPVFSYANGVLPEAMWLAYQATNNTKYEQIARETTEFLCEVCFQGEVFCPIGNKGWYPKGAERAYWDQQPEEVLATVEALNTAVKITGDATYREMAARAFWWFWGDNLLGKRIYDIKSGGARDGLNPEGANKNQGAESTLSYLLSAAIMDELQ